MTGYAHRVMPYRGIHIACSTKAVTHPCPTTNTRGKPHRLEIVRLKGERGTSNCDSIFESITSMFPASLLLRPPLMIRTLFDRGRAVTSSLGGTFSEPFLTTLKKIVVFLINTGQSARRETDHGSLRGRNSVQCTPLCLQVSNTVSCSLTPPFCALQRCVLSAIDKWHRLHRAAVPRACTACIYGYTMSSIQDFPKFLRSTNLFLHLFENSMISLKLLAWKASLMGKFLISKASFERVP